MYIFSKIIVMNYIYSYWKNNEGEKIQKSKRDEKNIMLETRIARNIQLNKTRNNNRFFEKFSQNNRYNLKLDHINFREEISDVLGTKNNNRDVLEERLNSRKIVNSGNLNPFIDQDKYITNINKQESYLRPKDSKVINKINEENTLHK